MPDEHLYWDNFPANRVPKSKVNIENQNMSVPPDSEVSGDPTEITMGPKKVFKKGYPTGKSVGVEGSAKGENMPSISPMVESASVEVLRTHGVTNDSRVARILHSGNMSVVASIASQKAIIMTEDYKFIDISAHQWPINLEAAVDVRSTLGTPVRYGDGIGIVAGTSGEFVMLKTKAGELMVSIHDLEPITADSEGFTRYKDEIDGMIATDPEGALSLFHFMYTPAQLRQATDLLIKQNPRKALQDFRTFLNDEQIAQAEEAAGSDPVLEEEPVGHEAVVASIDKKENA